MLKGIKVLQLASLLPGPLCGKMLQTLGAEVTVIEPPQGDSIRQYKFVPHKNTGEALYDALNCGKESIRLNFHDEDKKDIDTFKALAAETDVLIMSLRPGALEHVKLEAHHLRKMYEKLVICSITGYGLTEGPLRHRAGHDINYLARSGVLSMASQRSRDVLSSSSTTTTKLPLLRPFPVQIADVASGTYPAVTQILAQLFFRERFMNQNAQQQKPQHSLGDALGIIDVAMCDSTRSLSILNEAARQDLLGHIDVEGGTFMLSGSAPCYRFYPCAPSPGGPPENREERLIAVGALEPHFWNAFVGTIGIDAKFAAPKYQFAPEGSSLQEEVVTAITERMMTRTLREWAGILEANRMCCADPVLTGAEAAACPHFKARKTHQSSSLSGISEDIWTTVNSPFRVI